jgi:hypothetical protein
MYFYSLLPLTSHLTPHTSHTLQVFLKTGMKWEYDCEEKNGWGCYLNLGSCPDSIVSMGQIDISNSIKENQNPESPTSSVLDRSNREFPPTNSQFRQQFAVLYKALRKLGKVSQDLCDISQISFSNISAIATKHLFALNNETKASILSLNKKNYASIFRDSPPRGQGQYPSNYVSLQIRTQDKKGELTKPQWAQMTDISYIANCTSQHMHDYKHLFVATDNCSTVPALRKAMSSAITIHSACDLSETPNKALDVDVRRITIAPNSTGPSKGLSLLADVLMLRHGQEYV